jgi:hypothetical protein
VTGTPFAADNIFMPMADYNITVALVFDECGLLASIEFKPLQLVACFNPSGGRSKESHATVFLEHVFDDLFCEFLDVRVF